MSSKVRIGVVGTSLWADFMHLPSCSSHKGAELAAICGRNLERAGEMAQKYNIPQTFNDYREMIKSGGLDAVVVSVPDDLHYEISMCAIQHGLHVICEKPLAMTVNQAREMYERAEGSGLCHMTYFTNRWVPVVLYLHELVKSGYIGNTMFSEFRQVGGYALGPGYLWRQDGRRSLGVLGDLGSHLIDLSRWLVGEISAVNAHLTCNFERRDDSGKLVEAVNDSAMLITEYQNGTHGIIHVSNVSYIGDLGQESTLTLSGDDGTLRLTSNWKDGYRLVGAKKSDNSLAELRIPESLLNGVNQDDPPLNQRQQVFTEHAAGCRAFIDAIIEGNQPSPSFYDGLRAQEVIEAAFKSNRNKCQVTIL